MGMRLFRSSGAAVLLAIQLALLASPQAWPAAASAKPANGPVHQTGMGDADWHATAVLQELTGLRGRTAPVGGMGLRIPGLPACSLAPQLPASSGAITAPASALLSVGCLCVALHGFRGPPLASWNPVSAF